MDADAVVYDVSWSQLNASVRELNRKDSLTAPALEGLLELISGIFREVEEGAYRKALERLEKEVRPVLLPFFEEASEEDDKEAPLRAMFGKKQLPVSEALDKVVRRLRTRIETGGN